MTLFQPVKSRCRVIPLILLPFICSLQLKGAGPNDYFYRIYFTDKGENHPGSYTPGQLFSDRAIQRRLAAGIDCPDYRDIPVSSAYLNQVKSQNLSLHCTSRWMNTALFRSADPVNIESLEALPFISDVKLVKHPLSKGTSAGKFGSEADALEVYGYDKAVGMLKGNLLHSAGFRGKGILIAILDAGFTNADKASSLTTLRKRSGITGTYDFISRTKNVYGSHTHGTAVLSVLAGLTADHISGSAPEADYLLLRSEDSASEFPVEEDFWVAAAEYADSAGADIISTSLGYAVFDDPSMSYRFSDLDGNTAFVTRAADIAASKGMIVVASAGNERNKEWGRIITPADGDSVIAVGAVDSLMNISAFSSAGPSADGRVKPDLSAMGVNVIVQVSPDKITRSSGTSFSCPLISGLIACLLQAQPRTSQGDLIQALKQSADRYNTPDSLYGYGIPDARKTLEALQEIYLVKPAKVSLAWPNPTSGIFEISLNEEPSVIDAEIFSSSGTLILRKTYSEFAGRTIRFDELANRDNGIYYVRITTDKLTFVERVIKINKQ